MLIVNVKLAHKKKNTPDQLFRQHVHTTAAVINYKWDTDPEKKPKPALSNQ